MLLDTTLRLQAGLVSRQQALSAGLSTQRIDRMVATGQWLRVLPQIYLASGREYTAEARVRAAGLWAGESATVSGLAAAWWHGLVADPPSIVDVSVPVRRSLRAPPRVRVRRRDLADTDRVAIRGLTLTAVPLTVLEAAVALGECGSQLLDRALQRRVRFDTLYRAHCRNLGRRGSATAAKLLATAADRSASVAERKLIGLLRVAAVEGWVQHYRLCGYELDFAFPESRLAIEVDGWAWHQDDQAFRRDRQRQNRVVLAGWTVLRFSWHDLTQRPGEVIGEINSALDRR